MLMVKSVLLYAEYTLFRRLYTRAMIRRNGLSASYICYFPKITLRQVIAEEKRRADWINRAKIVKNPEPKKTTFTVKDIAEPKYEHLAGLPLYMESIKLPGKLK